MSLAADHLAAVPATPVLDEPSALLSPTVLKASPPRSPLRSPGGLSDLSRSPGKIISPRKAKRRPEAGAF